MLEDEFGDVVSKARWGRGLDFRRLAASSGVPAPDIERIEAGGLTPGEDQVQALAAALGLRTAPLLDLAHGRYAPAPPPDAAGPWRVRALLLSGPGGFTANTYLLWHADEVDCVIVDPGFDAERIVGEVEALGLEPRLVAVTHGHQDHAGQAPSVARRWNIPILLGSEDIELLSSSSRTPSLRPVADGDRVLFGRHDLSVIAAPGHTAGGRVFAVGDFAAAGAAAGGVAFVGDTLFAGSIGRTFGGPADYPVHLETIRRLLGLSPSTRLCPGHGPQTTVGQERQHNPFA